MTPEQLPEHGHDLGDGKARVRIPSRSELGLESLDVAGVVREAAREGRGVFDAQALDDAARIRGGWQPSHEVGRGFCGGWAVPVEIGVTLGVNMTFWGFVAAPSTISRRGPFRLCGGPSQHPGLELLGSVGPASTRPGLARVGRVDSGQFTARISTCSPRAMTTSDTSAGEKSPCSTTPTVPARRAASAAGSSISPV
jgi:hypothetical protein